MQAIKIRLIGLLCILICIGTPQYLLAQSRANPQTTEARKELREIYRSYLGVREKTGQNDGPFVEKFLRYTGLGKGYAWCASFVCSCLGEAKISNPRSAWSPDLFPSKKVIYQPSKNKHEPPNTGDVLGIYFENKKRIAHAGFIDDWPKVGVYTFTVEGNTNEAGSREGDGVYAKRRLKKSIYAVSRWIN